MHWIGDPDGDVNDQETFMHGNKQPDDRPRVLRVGPFRSVDLTQALHGNDYNQSLIHDGETAGIVAEARDWQPHAVVIDLDPEPARALQPRTIAAIGELLGLEPAPKVILVTATDPDRPAVSSELYVDGRVLPILPQDTPEDAWRICALIRQAHAQSGDRDPG